MYNRTNSTRPLQIKSIILFVILTLSPAHLFSVEAEKYFHTDFDGTIHTVKTVSDTVRPNIIGTDSKGNTFPNDLPGINPDDSDGSTLYNQFRTNVYSACADHISDYVIIDTREVTGAKGTPVKALYQELKTNPPVRSCYQPTGLTSAWYLKPRPGDPDNRESLATVYQRYWTKHHFDNPKSGWRLLTQVKSYDSTNAVRYKWSFYAISLSGNYHQFMLAFEHEYQGDQKNYYPNNNYKQPIYIPQDEWYKYEVFIKSSEGQDGILQFAVNDKIVLEHFGPNMDNSIANTGPLHPGHIRLTGPYGAHGYQMTTGLEIWSKPPSDSVLTGSSTSTSGGSFIIAPGVIK